MPTESEGIIMDRVSLFRITKEADFVWLALIVTGLLHKFLTCVTFGRRDDSETLLTTDEFAVGHVDTQVFVFILAEMVNV